MTDNRHINATTSMSMYDAKFTGLVTSEKGSFVAHQGRMRGPVIATSSASVNSVNSASGNVEPKLRSRLGASIDPIARALVLKVPESLKKSEPDNRNDGQTTRLDNDKLGTPALSEPRWSSGSQIVHTIRPITSASSLPQDKPHPAVLAAASRREESSGSSSGFHYIKTSDRLAAAAQGDFKNKDKELSKKASSNSLLSDTTKPKISAPIPQPRPNTDIFLRDSPTSESFTDDDNDNIPIKRSVDTHTSWRGGY